METRRFGRTGHMSTLAIFGAFAAAEVDQPTADRTMEKVIAAGVNHIDVAPSYGRAEERLGPWIKHERERFFLGCKTMERSKEGAERELHESLARLNTDHFDLYQIHAVTRMDELDAATRKGGAIEAMVAARDAGLTKYIGITGHGQDCPRVFLEALRRFDFDTILFPINFIQYAFPDYRAGAEELLRVCRARDVGTMIIKSISKRPWGDREHRYHMWYEPFDDMDMVQKGVNFALSQDVTGICTAGDYRTLPLQLEACENFKPMSGAEQEALIATASQYETIFETA